MKNQDETGKRYGLLLVLGHAGVTSGNAYWSCVCVCGSVKRVAGFNLRAGRSRSCGGCSRAKHGPKKPRFCKECFVVVAPRHQRCASCRRTHHNRTGRLWLLNNPGKARAVQEKRADRKKQTCRAWVEANRERARANRRARRARISGATGDMTNKEWIGIFDSYDRRCVYCGDAATTTDHVAPLVLGGAHSTTNCVPCCIRCNCSKGATPLVAWLARRPMPGWR